MAKQTDLLLLVFIFTSISSLNAHNYPFEYFQMVEQWGPATCSEAGVYCFAQPQPSFTIHGLWPSNFTNSYLTCPPGVPFDELQVATLVPQLELYWPDLKNGNHKGFWKYEWEKHGTCSDPPFNMFRYFGTALKAHKRYDLLNILNVAGFSPMSSGKLKYSDIEHAIKTKTTKKPHLRCNENSGTSKDQLFEVVLCFADDGVTLIDCPTPLPNRCAADFNWLTLHSLVSEGRDL